MGRISAYDDYLLREAERYYSEDDEENEDDEKYDKYNEWLEKNDNLLERPISEILQDAFFSGYESALKEQKAQIEKMKCCQNCKHKKRPETKESIMLCIKCKQLDENKNNILLTKWELAE